MEGISTLVEGNSMAMLVNEDFRRIYACAGYNGWLVIRGSDEGDTQANRDEEADSGCLYSLN